MKQPSTLGLEPSPDLPRIVQLDGVRGLAILMVLIWHFVVIMVQVTPGTFPAYCLKALSLTWSGVDLFFVLSGFLLGGILIDKRSAASYFRPFYVRRACRILPIYYLVFLLFLIAIAFYRPGSSEAADWLMKNPMPLWTYPAFVQNFSMAQTGQHGAHWLGVTWSLAIEEQFYILLPFLIRFTPPRHLVKILVLLVLCAPAFRTYCWLSYPNGGFAGFVLLPGRWDSLLLGVLGAIFVRSPRYDAWMEANSRLLRYSLCVFLAGAFVLIATNQGISSLGMSAIGHTWLAALSLNVILISLDRTPSLWKRALSHPWLVWLGSISFGVYLYHQVFNGLSHLAITGQSPKITGLVDGSATLVGLALTLIIATVSLQFFEKPIIRVGHRVAYRAAG